MRPQRTARPRPVDLELLIEIETGIVAGDVGGVELQRFPVAGRIAVDNRL